MTKISNLLKNISLCLCFMVAAVFLFAGCGSGFPAFKDNPSSTDVVSGNGSFAVTKGNYLYFANGFKEASSVLEGENGKADYASLYRVKLDEFGHVTEREKEYDSEGNEIFDQTQAIVNVDILCKKVVGFESMGLYIFGDYIYFATPNDEKGVVDGSLSLRTDLIDICRTKIDRSSGVEKLYTTQNAATDCKYTMVQNGNEVVLIVVDKDKIVVRKIVNNKIQGTQTVAENVTSYALPSYSRSDVALTDFDKNVYYTRDVTDSDSVSNGNILMKFNLDSLKTSVVRADDATTFTVKQTNGKYLYVEESYSELGYNYSSLIYAFENFDTDSVRGTKVAANSYTSFAAIDASVGIGIVAGDGTNIYLINKSANVKKQIYAGTGTFVKVDKNNFYFIAEENLYSINYTTDASAVNITENTSAHLPSAEYVCIDGSKIFYFKEYENSTGQDYLHMIDLNSVDDDVVYDHFVGVLMESDYLTDPSTENAD